MTCALAAHRAARQLLIERFEADVAEVMHDLALPPAILVGHGMGAGW
jgi:pimeloyl-ACP methyl ester carboxylesterase